jgi:peptide/nickel transport system substrate-binding protein
VRSVAWLVGLVAFLLAGCSGGGEPTRSGDTLVVATIADPVALDGALASDAESQQVVAQVVEGLTALAPGTTRVVRKLAVRWRASDGGRTWTFVLRRGVRFQDGTAFDARAVCFNFDRWYGFTGDLQDPDATYYWHEIFGGFRTGTQPSLYRACRADGPGVVRLLLQRPFGALPAALATPAFGIASPQALARYRADEGDVNHLGDFLPDGTYATHHPTGTGPFRFRSWVAGSRLELQRNADYWGPPPRVERLEFRPIDDESDRLDAVRNGAVDIADLYGRREVASASAAGVRIESRPPFDVGYLGINQRHGPLGNPLVREAIAYGLDRAAVVGAFYPDGARVAREFVPPTLAGYAADVPRYEYDPERARGLLRRAGVSLPVRVDLWYPTEVRRPYLPEPERIARRFAAGLDRAGFRIDLRPSPWLPDYLRLVRSGGAALFLLGWVGDYADAGAFLDPIFVDASARFGTRDAELEGLLRRARAEPDAGRRAALYRNANRKVMQTLPAVPFVTTRQPVAVSRAVHGFVPSPLGIDSFAGVSLSPR